MSIARLSEGENVLLSGNGRIEEPIKDTVRIYLTEKRLLFTRQVGLFKKKEEVLLDAGLDQIEYANAEGGKSDVLIVTARIKDGSILTYRVHVETPQVWSEQLKSLKSGGSSVEPLFASSQAKIPDVRAKLLELGTLVDKDHNRMQYQSVMENYQNYYLIGAILSALATYGATLTSAIVDEWVVGIIIMVLFLVYWNYSPRFTKRTRKSESGLSGVRKSYVSDLNVKNIISTQLAFGLICLASIGILVYGVKQVYVVPILVLAAYGLAPIAAITFEKRGRFYREPLQKSVVMVKARLPSPYGKYVDWIAKWGLVVITILALIYSLATNAFRVDSAIGLGGLGLVVGLQLVIYAFLRSYLGSSVSKSILNETISRLNTISDRIKQTLLENTLDESLYNEIRLSYIRAIPFTVSRNPFLLFNFHKIEPNPFYLKSLQGESLEQKI